MLARRTNLPPKPPVVEKAASLPTPVRRPPDPLLETERKRGVRHGQSWKVTKVERTALVRLIWQDLSSIPAVARHVGVTKEVISNMAKNLGLHNRTITMGRKS
jgi:hypothetical protein